MSKHARVVVDSGTHAGIHVPVADLRSILMVSINEQSIHNGIEGEMTNSNSIGDMSLT